MIILNATNYIIFNTFAPNILCPENLITNKDIPLKMSVNPSIFGFAKDTWKTNIGEWCDKVIKIQNGNNSVIGVVNSYCPIDEDFDFKINFSNGERSGDACVFNNSINLLFDEGEKSISILTDQ
jgi:hypothetical protein